MSGLSRPTCTCTYPLYMPTTSTLLISPLDQSKFGSRVHQLLKALDVEGEVSRPVAVARPTWRDLASKCTHILLLEHMRVSVNHRGRHALS